MHCKFLLHVVNDIISSTADTYNCISKFSAWSYETDLLGYDRHSTVNKYTV